MLRRDRQIRRQVHQLMDACLFAVSFWLAYQLRASADIIDLFGLLPVNPIDPYAVLYLILIPAGPLILETQGFYARPLLCSRRTTAWLLFKSCLLMSLGLVLALFFLQMLPLRAWVVIWFGFISFGLVFAKEEVLQWARRSQDGAGSSTGGG